MKCIVLWQWSFYIVYYFLSITLIVVGSSIPASGLTMDSLRGNDEQSNAIDSNMTPFTRKADIEPNSVNTGTTDTSLEEQLKDDQMALKRMILILSLVGGLGALAIIITVIIFTKVRKRKQWINDKNSESPPLTDDDDIPIQDYHSSSIHQRNDYDRNDRHESVGLIQNDDNERLEQPSTLSSGLEVLQLPSAPPIIIPDLTTSSTIGTPCRHILTTLQQQSMPIPSAPSAKELDNYQRNTTCSLCDSDEEQHGNLDSHISIGLDNSTILSPEIPPPAYTPSAPPLHDRPHMDDTILLRRYSQT